MECFYAQGYQPSYGFWGILFMSGDYGKDDIRLRQKKPLFQGGLGMGFLDYGWANFELFGKVLRL